MLTSEDLKQIKGVVKDVVEDVVETKIENLSVMINKGFDNQMEHMQKNFVAKKDLEGLASKEDVKKLSRQLDALSEDLKKNNNLEMRMDYVENVLAIKRG